MHFIKCNDYIIYTLFIPISVGYPSHSDTLHKNERKSYNFIYCILTICPKNVHVYKKSKKYYELQQE